MRPLYPGLNVLTEHAVYAIRDFAQGHFLSSNIPHATTYDQRKIWFYYRNWIIILLNRCICQVMAATSISSSLYDFLKFIS